MTMNVQDSLEVRVQPNAVSFPSLSVTWPDTEAGKIRLFKSQILLFSGFTMLALVRGPEAHVVETSLTYTDHCCVDSEEMEAERASS